MAALPHSFVQLFVDLNLAKYTSLAAVTVLVYDYFILLPDEIALIWPSRWSISKCLFIANRYLAFVDPTMIIYLLMFGERAGVCVNTFRAIGVFTTIGIMVAQWILLLRTYAVWGSKISKPFVCVFVCYVCIGVVDSWASHKYVNGVHSTGVPGKGMTGCTLFFANRLAWVSFVGIMAIESALISLLVYKAVQHFRVARSSLMTILYRDGLLYFAFVLATSICEPCGCPCCTN
ncbi:hypothetical protein BD410DRAFT_783333 [Rickenella mellea]|uniref:DUF6533 domain-containing protein n=1 Tax=Rickenella mellea TaxID=50990 RepID=A0A4Y7QJX5_9AGAM|nr:hypothetical protein BD410DRAFT_783333 [Rickenella mellea]